MNRSNHIRSYVIVAEVCNRIIIELENISSHARALRSSKPKINAFPKKLIKTDQSKKEHQAQNRCILKEYQPINTKIGPMNSGTMLNFFEGIL